MDKFVKEEGMFAREKGSGDVCEGGENVHEGRQNVHKGRGDVREGRGGCSQERNLQAHHKTTFHPLMDTRAEALLNNFVHASRVLPKIDEDH